MNEDVLALRRLTVAVALAVGQIGAVHAADAAPAAQAQEQAAPAAATDAAAAEGELDVEAEADAEPLNLDTLIVTGTSNRVSKMRSSVSVSTMGQEQIQQSAPSNAAEVLRSVPGIRAESSGGEGNANLTVRGLPISAGGTRYVQFQEDGLPILQFGDIAFATPDMFMRVDGGLERVEVVRGGSASTLATNAPGGIINFITRSGAEKGGSVGITRVLNFDQTRYDFNYGTPLGESTRAFIAGFYRSGEGGENPEGQNIAKGGQLRGNITHDFGNGYVRLNFKHLDDQTPMSMPVPVRYTADGGIDEIRGIDPRRASFYSPHWVRDLTLTKSNRLASTDVNDGLTIESDSVGAEAMFELGNGWTIENRFRHSENKGRFVAIFPADDVAPASSFAAFTGTYATGPRAGQAYTGNAFTATVFNTSLDDLGNTVNDFKVSKDFEGVAGGKLTTTAGLFYSLQNVSLTWNFNQYLMEASGENPALLDTGSATAGLVAMGTDVWGGCCSRAIDAEYRTTSPYFNLAWEGGEWNVDASVRHDNQEAEGWYNQAVDQRYERANRKDIDYKVDHTSYSIGANYRVTPNLAVFARSSDGVAFNADRIMFQFPLDESVPIPVNEVQQHELGVKWREGPLSTFVTLFSARTKERNYDATTQVTTANTYDSKGVELEAGYSMGDFSIRGGATYTDSEIVDAIDTALVGETPQRQARWVYQIMPSYDIGVARIGASVIGTTSSKDGPNRSIKMPAYAVVNLFASYKLTSAAELSMSVNNLFDTIGYTEANDGRGAARSVAGRTIKAGLKYSF